MKRILVTGGAGFIASHLISRLLHLGDEVIAIDNFNGYYSVDQKRSNIRPFLLHRNFTLYEIDITGPEAFSSLTGGFDSVVHLAAYAGVRGSVDDPIRYLTTNVLGTQNLLEWCKRARVPQVLFASSSSVYGTNPRLPWREDDFELQPVSPYASTKASGEMMGGVYSRLFGIQFLALRLFTVYGPRQRPDLAIHTFTRAIAEGKSITIYGSGDSIRDYTYIDDIVDAICAALQYTRTRFEVINVGCGSPVSLLQLIRCLERVSGLTASLQFQDLQAADVPATHANVEKAATLLGYTPKTSIHTGLSRFYQWFQESRMSLR